MPKKRTPRPPAVPEPPPLTRESEIYERAVAQLRERQEFSDAPDRDLLTEQQVAFVEHFLGDARGDIDEAARLAGFDASVGLVLIQNRAVHAYMAAVANGHVVTKAEQLLWFKRMRDKMAAEDKDRIAAAKAINDMAGFNAPKKSAHLDVRVNAENPWQALLKTIRAHPDVLTDDLKLSILPHLDADHAAIEALQRLCREEYAALAAPRGH